MTKTKKIISEQKAKGLCPLVPSRNSQPWEQVLRGWKVTNNFKDLPDFFHYFSPQRTYYINVIFQPWYIHKGGRIHPMDKANNRILSIKFTTITRLRQKIEVVFS